MLSTAAARRVAVMRSEAVERSRSRPPSGRGSAAWGCAAFGSSASNCATSGESGRCARANPSARSKDLAAGGLPGGTRRPGGADSRASSPPSSCATPRLWYLWLRSLSERAEAAAVVGPPRRAKEAQKASGATNREGITVFCRKNEVRGAEHRDLVPEEVRPALERAHRQDRRLAEPYRLLRVPQARLPVPPGPAEELRGRAREERGCPWSEL